MPCEMYKEDFEKRNPNFTALWQKPRSYNSNKLDESDEVCYCNVPLGKTAPLNLLGRMSKKAGMPYHLKLHSIRATTVSILKVAGLENSRVRSVSSHKSKCLNRVIPWKTNISTAAAVIRNCQKFCGSSDRLLTFKVLHGQCPDYLQNLFVFLSLLLKPPPVMWLVTLGDQSLQ